MKRVMLSFLLIVMMLAGITTPRSVQAADSIVSSVNFNDSTTGSWIQSGSPTLTYVDDGNGGKALSMLVKNSWDGIQSPADIFEPGIVYTFSMRAMLTGDGPGSTGFRFVFFSEDTDEATTDHYDWIGNTNINATGWTTITGTFTLPAGRNVATAKVYTGPTEILDSGGQKAPYTILVDDILVTRPAAVVTIASVDFDDGTTGNWFQSGSPTLSYISDGSGGQALSMLVKNSWDGIQSPSGIFEPGVVYTFSMRAMLTGDGPSSTGFRFVFFSEDTDADTTDHYDWIGNTNIITTGWTTITGTFTLPAGRNVATAKVYTGPTEILDSNNQKTPYTILVDDILITTPDTGGGTTIVLETDFESGLDGWVVRQGDSTPATVTLTETESHSPTHAALVTDRDGQGDGIGHSVTGIMKAGETYNITAWVKFANGTGPGDIWLSLQRSTGGSDSFSTLGQFANMTGDTWREVTTSVQMPDYDSAFLYFETRYPDGTTDPFLIDDIVIEQQGGPDWDPTLTPLKNTTEFPVGVAIDQRETTGAYSELLLHHFDQITPENQMKPDAWYDANRNFRMHPDAKTLMDFAVANNLRVYGHTLLWHQQTPAWFFQRDDGTDLTNSPEDQLILSTRLHDHIFNVAKALHDAYGPFGSDTNPIVAFDVVNEVISDSAEPDGLRRSPYYNILGPSYIRDAFNWANEAFNVQYAAAGADRPVALVINDYNTDQAAKRERLHNLVSQLLAENIPVDVVGHQFHVSLTTPIQGLEDAFVDFEDLPVMQAVTELDVLTGTPVDDAKIIEQGYYYRDAFRIFRSHTDDMFCVTVWGLYDSRSWRSAQAPLLFDDQLAAKPAYFGAVDEDLPARLRTALVFQGDVQLDAWATSSIEWLKLRLNNVADKFGFQLRWTPDHLSVFVDAKDATPESGDKLTFIVGDRTYTFNRDGTGDVDGVVEEVEGGWKAVVRLPLNNAAQDDQVQFDIALTDGVDTTGWNDAGATGTLSFAEPLSYLEVAAVGSEPAPVIDGEVDAVWGLAGTVTTGMQTTGSDTASADVKTLWQDNTLYVLLHVHDPVLNDTASDPWQKDSVEIYVDAGNYKNGTYRPDDTQIRINYKNETSFGTGDAEDQQARLVSATKVVDDGYLVEASISLLDEGGLGTFHGLDFQVNDAQNGARTGIRNWADPTNAGYLSTSHWGVGRLVVTASLEYAGSKQVVINRKAKVNKVDVGAVLSTLNLDCLASQPVRFVLDRNPVTGESVTTPLGTAETNADGRAKLTVETSKWKVGKYTLTVSYEGSSMGCGGSTTSVTLTVKTAP